jgi:site-specific recombinase XerD
MPAPDDVTFITSKRDNRHTAPHHQRETSALETARQNRHTDPLHTASADRRHSAATRWLRDGVSIEVVSKLLGHSSVTTTSAIYGHLTIEDARAALEKAGWLTGREVTL